MIGSAQLRKTFVHPNVIDSDAFLDQNEVKSQISFSSFFKIFSKDKAVTKETAPPYRSGQLLEIKTKAAIFSFIKLFFPPLSTIVFCDQNEHSLQHRSFSHPNTAIKG